MMKIIRAWLLGMFAFGTALMVKHYGVAEWLEANTWLCYPMFLIGFVGIVVLWECEQEG